jgi:hypothetical protein
MQTQHPPERLSLLAATLVGCGSNIILIFSIGLCWGLVALTYATSPEAPADVQALYEYALVGIWGIPLIANGAVLVGFGLRHRWDVVSGFLVALSLIGGLVGLAAVLFLVLGWL